MGTRTDETRHGGEQPMGKVKVGWQIRLWM